MTAVCFRISPADTVATLLADAEAGPVELRGAGVADTVTLAEPIELGHKVALVDIDEGGAIVKYGVTIGLATHAVRRGQWVHLHNCRSAFDERSSSLDLHTGAASEIRYE
jgi:altronate dehydratase